MIRGVQELFKPIDQIVDSSHWVAYLYASGRQVWRSKSGFREV